MEASVRRGVGDSSPRRGHCECWAEGRASPGALELRGGAVEAECQVPRRKCTPEQGKSLALLGGGGNPGGAPLQLTLACGWEGHVLGGVCWSGSDTPTFSGYPEPVSVLPQRGPGAS